MAKVQIGLGAVIGDEDLAMLKGAHGAGIDVQIGIEFAQPDRIAARLQQRPQRRRCQPLSKGRNHTAGDEDITRHEAPVSNQIDDRGPNLGGITGPDLYPICPVAATDRYLW